MIEQFASFACVSELRHTVGETPIKHLRLKGDQPRKLSLLAKVEGENPTGTMKDRSAYYIIRKAVSEGQIHRDRPVTASSSGGFALAAARLCHALGVCFLPVIDPNTPPFIRSQLGCFCTRIHEVAKADLNLRLDLVRNLVNRHDAFDLDQYTNVAAPMAFYESLGGEIVRDAPGLDAIVVPVSSAGTIAGLSMRVKEHHPSAEVLAVDLEGSVVFGGPPAPRRIPGIGSSRKPELLQLATIDHIEVVSERDAMDGCRALLHQHGIHAGASSGCVYAAALRAYAGSKASTPRKVVLVLPDHGRAYTNLIDYNPAIKAANEGRAPHEHQSTPRDSHKFLDCRACEGASRRDGPSR